MSKRFLCAILAQILVLISSMYEDSMSLDIYRARAHFDQTGNFTPLVVILSCEDKSEKMKGVDLICIVDVSGSMSGQKLSQVKQSLKYLVSIMNEQDNFALIKFSTSATIIKNFTQMTSENKTDVINKIESFYASGNTDIYSSLEKALDMITHDYSDGERIASIILLSDGQDTKNGKNVPKKFSDLLKATNKGDYAFTLHTFGYGNDHDADTLKELAKVKGGSFVFVNETNIDVVYLEFYASLSTICNVNFNLTIESEFTLVKVYGMEEMYKASLYNKTLDNKPKLFLFSTVLIHAVYGKIYAYVVLVDIPKDTPIGTEVLNAKVTPFGLEKRYSWDLQYYSIAYEEYIKCISVTYFSNAFEKGYNGGVDIIKEGLTWITMNYNGTRNWIAEFNEVIVDFNYYSSYGRANLLSKIYELKTSCIGTHYSMDNTYIRSIIDKSYNIDVSKLPVMTVMGEKIINFTININYYYFYLKEGSGKINNLYFSGEGSSLIIYSDNPSGNIKITSLSEYIEFYYWNETKSRNQNIVDFGHGGKFIMEKDFPFDFYARIDSPKDITFNIEFLKLECVEKIEISKHLFEVIAYVVDSTEIKNLNNNKDYKPAKTAFNGYYESMLSLGTIVIKKEEIANYIVSNNLYLYVIIKKSPEVNITYNYTEGQFIFVSMDYIYSTIPAGFMISSHLSEGQKTPHLYTFEGRNITIEITYIGVELIFKIIKYKIYQTGTEEFYEDYSGFIIKRREEKNKKYIDVIQKIQENEGNTTSSKLILSIFSNNTDHVAGNNTTSISYSMRYETHPYIDFDDDTDYISENNIEGNETEIQPPFHIQRLMLSF